MPQVIVDPDELRQFANYLDQVAESLRGRKSHLDSELRSLEEVWKDTKYRRFKRDYDDVSRGLDEFVRSAMSYAGYLRKKAALADRFLDR